MNTVMTNHAQERLKERYGVKSKKKAQRICDNAHDRGVSIISTSGKLKKWLDQKTRPGTYLMCYQNLAFVFSEGRNECITVLNIPKAVQGARPA